MAIRGSSSTSVVAWFDVAVVVACVASSGHESESERSLSLCAGTAHDHDHDHESHAVGVTYPADLVWSGTRLIVWSGLVWSGQT